MASKDTTPPKQPQRELFTAEPVLGQVVRTGLAVITPLWQQERRTPGVVPSTLGRFPCRPRALALATSRAWGQVWTMLHSAGSVNGIMKGPVEPKG